MPETDRPAELPAELAGPLNSARLAGRLGRLARDVHFFPSVSSTNDLAIRLADRGAPGGTLVLAAEQTAGRGRSGRTWHSPPGAGLYASVLLRPDGDSNGTPAWLPLVTLASGVALCEGLRAATGLPIELKWPNDLVVPAGRRWLKLGGILTEAPAQQGRLVSVVLGFGVNVRSAAYPPDLADRASSLEREAGRPVEPGPVLVECVAGLAAWWERLQAGDTAAVVETWRRLAPSAKGRIVEWRDGTRVRRGRTLGVDERGALVVRDDETTVALAAGEVVWL